MSTLRFPSEGGWYKGNTHIHTNRSDGGMEPHATAELYAGAGYDFIAFTDHWVPSRIADDPEYPLLVLDGVELDGNDENGVYYHVVCIGGFRNVRREDGFQSSLYRCIEQGGMAILAHPYWTGNTIEDSLAHPFAGVEVYNHVCQWLNGKGSGAYVYDAVLQSGRQVLGLAVDDAHLRPEHPGWNGGWIMVRAESLSDASISTALRNGDFYSTQGPRIEEANWDGSVLTVRTSPARFARLVGAKWAGARDGAFDGPERTAFSVTIPKDFGYARLEIEDSAGRKAWTNPLF